MTAPERDAAVFELAFVINCHQLIGLGYDRLNAAVMQTWEETEITGDLVDAMDECLCSDSCPAELEHFETKDDAPQSVHGKKGKRRPRVDITIVRTGRGARRRIHFEAKRLYRAESVSQYVGPDGLGMFLNGSYGKDDSVGAMLGYVQQGKLAEWATKIRDELHGSPAKYGLEVPPGLVDASGTTKRAFTYRSSHERSGVGNIGIFHSLLLFQ
jgi:hypothetical protein